MYNSIARKWKLHFPTSIIWKTTSVGCIAKWPFQTGRVKSCSIWDAEIVVARCHSAIFRNRQSKIMSKFTCGHYGLGQPVDSYCGWKRLAWPPMAVLWNTSAIWGLQNGEIIFRRKLSVIYFGFGFWLSFGEILPLYYLNHYLYHLLRCTCVTEPWHTVLEFHELWNEVRRCYSLNQILMSQIIMNMDCNDWIVTVHMN